MLKRFWLPIRILVLPLWLLWLTAPAASAQISMVGPTQDAIDTLVGAAPEVRGNDSAVRPGQPRVLVVGAYGPVQGVFVNEAGQPVTPAFQFAPGTILLWALPPGHLQSGCEQRCRRIPGHLAPG